MDSIELLREMRQNLCDLLDDLMIVLPEEKELIWFKIFAKTVPMLDVMKYVIKNILPLEGKIRARDDEYFKKHAVLFEKLGEFKTEVNHFKMLWETNENIDDREMIWRWLEHFIEIGKQYRAVNSIPRNGISIKSAS